MYTFNHFDMHKLQFSPGVFLPYHMFIHENKNAVISILLVFMGIYMYTLLYLHAQSLK